MGDKIRKGRSWDRLTFLFYLIFLCFLALIYKLVVIQVMKEETFTKQAFAQRIKNYNLSANRGSIYDRNGVTLALSTDMDTVSANPYQVKNKRHAAKQIAPILGESADAIYKKLIKKTGFVYLGRKLSKTKADRLKKLSIEGLWFSKESKRLYPGADLAAHVLGFVDTDNKGLAGLELSFDKLLKGKPGKLSQEQDRLGRPIPGGKNKYIPATNGHELVLTIDKEIQYKAQQELKIAIDEFKAGSGSIIVMNPNNGEIYALASAPDFDLNNFSREEDGAVFTNHAILDRYEPGSTMKVITGAAALEENLYSPESTFILPGMIKVGGWPIHDSHERGTEQFTFKSIITRSSNIGAATIAGNLGKERLYSYIDKFGLLRPTGIDLPGESRGYVPELKDWSASSLATISFGQGISATPIEMASALAIIANGGLRVEPKLVRDVISSTGKKAKYGARVPAKRVISPSVAANMSKILADAVEEGTGKSAKVKGYSVAGKTGTARKSNVGKPGYSTNYISSFAGFTPAKHPSLLILVVIDEPQKAIYGSVVAAPVFSRVANFALQRLKVLPDRPEPIN